MTLILFTADMPRAVAHLTRADPVLAALIARLPEPRLEAGDDRFLALVDAIVSQQLSGKVAATILRRVLDRFPDGATPAAVLAIAPEQLRAAGLSGAKVRYLRALAEAVASGSLDLQAIDQLDDEAAIAALTRVAGIGRWTAEMFLIFSLGRPDVLPAGDLGLRAALRRHYALEALPDPVAIRAIGAAWQPFCSIATLYLWRSLDER